MAHSARIMERIDNATYANSQYDAQLNQVHPIQIIE